MSRFSGTRTWNGYCQIWFDDAWCFEHRVKVERHILQRLPLGYVVHHIDQDRTNNAIENLALLKEHDHLLVHRELARGNSTSVDALLDESRTFMRRLRAAILTVNERASRPRSTRTILRRAVEVG